MLNNQELYRQFAADSMSMRMPQVGDVWLIMEKRYGHCCVKKKKKKKKMMMMMRNTTRTRRGMPGLVLRFCGGLLLLGVFASSASAAIRPSFYLDYSVWKATHIVLATEGDSIDGRLRVIESWKGNLEAGAGVQR